MYSSVRLEYSILSDLTFFCQERSKLFLLDLIYISLLSSPVVHFSIQKSRNFSFCCSIQEEAHFWYIYHQTVHIFLFKPLFWNKFTITRFPPLCWLRPKIPSGFSISVSISPIQSSSKERNSCFSTMYLRSNLQNSRIDICWLPYIFYPLQGFRGELKAVCLVEPYQPRIQLWQTVLKIFSFDRQKLGGRL